MYSILSAIPLATGITAGLETVAFGILNAIIFFIVFIFSHIAQSVYDYFIRNAFNPTFLFPGIGVGGITNGGTSVPAGFTSAWFYPNVHFAGESVVNGIYRINEDILGFVAVPMIFFMIVIQVFAVFFDVLEGKLPMWREWFAKITVAVVLAVLSYWIAGAVLLLGYLPFYALWTGFTFHNAYALSGHSWMWSAGAVLLPQNIPGFITSGPQGVIQLIFLSVELMVIFLLWFMIVLRNAILLFLVAVLPIASMLLATNWTASIGKKLWRLFVELSFLPFFVALPLWIFSTLMWNYGAWAQNSLGAYMADMGFLIFALGMPYLFLEGIGMLQGMGFPSAGQAVSMGTQTGMMLAGVSAGIAVGTAKSTMVGAAGGLSSARSGLGMVPSSGGVGSGGSGPGGGGGNGGMGSGIYNVPASHIQNATAAHQMQDQVGIKLPGMFAVGKNFIQYAGSAAYFGAGLLSSVAVKGIYGLYHKVKANQGAELVSLKSTDPAQHAKIMGTMGGRRANMHYQLEQAKLAHADVADFAHEYWDSPEAQSHWQSVVMHGSGTFAGVVYKDGDTQSGLMSDLIRQRTEEYAKTNPLQKHQARNFAIFNTVREMSGWAHQEAGQKNGWGGVFHVKGDASNSLPGSGAILQNHERFVSGAAFNTQAEHLDTYWNNHRRDVQSNIDGHFASKRSFLSRK